jgi:hypothetical protein
LLLLLLLLLQMRPRPQPYVVARLRSGCMHWQGRCSCCGCMFLDGAVLRHS